MSKNYNTIRYISMLILPNYYYRKTPRFYSLDVILTLNSLQHMLEMIQILEGSGKDADLW